MRMRLVLAGCLIGKTGIADVARPLKDNNHVRHVDLSSNGLNEFGATQIADVLRLSKSLRTLSLDGKLLFPALKAELRACLLILYVKPC